MARVRFRNVPADEQVYLVRVMLDTIEVMHDELGKDATQLTLERKQQIEQRLFELGWVEFDDDDEPSLTAIGLTVATLLCFGDGCTTGL